MTPLWRNRDFVLLQAGYSLSAAGSGATAIAYPLLVLALTHSSAKAGVVGFAELAPTALFGLLAGVAADRWNRKLLMVAADVVRAAALGGLAAYLLAGGRAFWPIALAAFVEGSGSALFSASSAAALRAVVPPSQLPAASAARGARAAAVRVLGPPFGGALFGVARAVPFVVDAASYAFSTAAVLAIRKPFQETRERDRSPLRAQVGEGFRFLWGEPFVRASTLLYSIGNVTIPGVMLVLVVAGRRQGLSAGGVGALLSAFGAATLLGALASPLWRRLLPVRAIMLMEFWGWVPVWAYVIRPDVWVLLASVLPLASTFAVTDSVVDGYRLAIVPDHLLGRVESVRRTISISLAPLGPLLTGVMLSLASARATVAVLATLGLVLVACGTLSLGLRRAPRLDDLKTALGDASSLR